MADVREENGLQAIKLGQSGISVLQLRQRAPGGFNDEIDEHGELVERLVRRRSPHHKIEIAVHRESQLVGDVIDSSPEGHLPAGVITALFASSLRLPKFFQMT